MKTLVEIVRYRTLIRNLVAKDLTLKYRGSALGFLWSLANPLVMILIYSLAFRYIIHIGVPDYTAVLIAGLLPWTFFASSCVMSTGSIVDNAGLIKKIPFPRVVLPLATVLFNFIQLLIAFLVFLPFLFVFLHGARSWTALGVLPLALAGQLLFTVGVAQVLSTATVFFRDVRHLVEVGLPMLFWLTPILYPLSLAPEPIRSLLRLNPMTGFVLMYQSLLVRGVLPDALTVFQVVFSIAAAALAGSMVFARWSPHFAEQV
jgi:ABC-2 type transport system permease protein